MTMVDENPSHNGILVQIAHRNIKIVIVNKIIIMADAVGMRINHGTHHLSEG